VLDLECLEFTFKVGIMRTFLKDEWVSRWMGRSMDGLMYGYINE
jgi:hypothetical protein